jgi:hypothetical protein
LNKSAKIDLNLTSAIYNLSIHEEKIPFPIFFCSLKPISRFRAETLRKNPILWISVEDLSHGYATATIRFHAKY